MSISVIICTRDRSDTIGQALESVCQCDYSHFDVHIMDQSTNDQTALSSRIWPSVTRINPTSTTTSWRRLGCRELTMRVCMSQAEKSSPVPTTTDRATRLAFSNRSRIRIRPSGWVALRKILIPPNLRIAAEKEIIVPNLPIERRERLIKGGSFKVFAWA